MSTTLRLRSTSASRSGPGGAGARLARTRRLLRVETLTFLVVGGVGYVVDIGAFNLL